MSTEWTTDQTLLRLQARLSDFGHEVAHVLAPVPAEAIFGELIESIIAQQLSTKVARVITDRARSLVDGAWTIEAVLGVPHESWRAVGLSNAKGQYVQHIAAFFQEQQLHPAALLRLPDEEVIKLLTQIKGVGRWTVEMLLIFAFGRPDVFSAGDYGLRKAMSRWYGIDADTTKQQVFAEFAERWQPQRSLVSRILWKSLELPKSVTLD